MYLEVREGENVPDKMIVCRHNEKHLTLLSRPQPRIFTRVYLTVCLNQSVYLSACLSSIRSVKARHVSSNPARGIVEVQKAEVRQPFQSKQSAGNARTCCPPLINVFHTRARVCAPETDQNHCISIFKCFGIWLFPSIIWGFLKMFFFFFACENITGRHGRWGTDRAGPCWFWCYTYRITSLSTVADMLAASADRKQTRQFSFYSFRPSSYLPPSPKQIGCLGHFFAVYWPLKHLET